MKSSYIKCNEEHSLNVQLLAENQSSSTPQFTVSTHSLLLKIVHFYLTDNHLYKIHRV